MPTSDSFDRLAEAVRLCKACPLGTMGRGVPGMWADEALSALEHHPECKPPYHGGWQGRCIGRCQAKQELVMVLGEAPGGVEMARGKPFVGQSGELLHSMLKEAGLTSYYVSNIAKHQPPKVRGKQTEPDKSVIEACAPFLRAEFELVKPTKLILLGLTAAKLVCKGNFRAKSVMNQIHEYYPPRLPVRADASAPIIRMTEPSPIPTLLLYHPAHFLYNRTAPWIQKQISEWKRAVRMFLGGRPPTYQIEKVKCGVHD